MLEALGIIAGSKNLPFLIAREARATGIKRVVAVAFEAETDPKLADVVDEIVWLRVGQLSKLIKAFRDREVKQCVMAGQIAPKNLFDVRPDIRAAMLLFKLKEKNAHTIFGGIADELAKDGVTLIEATPWLGKVMPGAGVVMGKKPGKQEVEDAAYGYSVAKEVARLDIGQTVVVKDGVVLAVEGFEGTDACIKRGGELAGKKGGGVAVKVAKPNHDMRFDIPCIGLNTVRIAAEAQIRVLAIEASKTIILEKEEVEQELARRKMSLVTVGE